MATTPNLGLPVNNSTTDRQKKFLTYSMEQNGNLASTNTIIDTWAGNVNKKITSLENNKTTVIVNARWISTGYYEVVTEEIKEYKVDMLITVRLNQDNDGTTTLKINDLAVKSLLKYNSEGVLVNIDAKDLRKNHEYQFRYDGTAFVWQDGTSADQISIRGTNGNVVGVSSNNTLEDSGIAIGNGELRTIDKTIIGGINEIKTSNDSKIDKTQIKNTLEETVVGNVLDATKGKYLNDKIGDTTTLTTTNKTSTVAAINEMNNVDTTGSLANKISILSGFSVASKIDSSFNVRTPIVTIMQALTKDRNLNDLYVERADGNNYPSTFGKITTIGNGNGRTLLYVAFNVAIKEYYIATCNYDVNGVATVTNWEKLTTASEMNVLSELVVWKPNNWKKETDVPNQYPLNSVTRFNTRGTIWNGKGWGSIETTVGEHYEYGGIIQKRYGVDGQPVEFRLSNGNGTAWGKWQQNATTDKVDILLTPMAGYTLIANASVQINNVLYIRASYQTTSGNIPTGTLISQFATSPIDLGQTRNPLSISFRNNSSGTIFDGGTCYASNKMIVLKTPSTGTFDQIFIGGVVVL